MDRRQPDGLGTVDAVNERADDEHSHGGRPGAEQSLAEGETDGLASLLTPHVVCLVS